MIEGLKPYARYRPSGVPAIGALPQHWETRKLRHCGEIRGGMTPSMSDSSFWNGGTIPWVTPKDMKRADIGNSIDHVTNEALSRTALRLIPPGSVLLVTRGMILARRVPIARTTAPVTINQDMKAIVPRGGLSSEYLALAMETAQEEFCTLIDEAGHGTKRLPTERWRELVLPCPAEDEQRAIVRFLDYADHRIRKHIAAKRKLIALLEEQKRAIIDRAVTRGLDANVRLKDSGVPGMKMVPAHWHVESFTRLAIERADYRGATPKKTDAGIFLVTARNVRRGHIDYECSREYVAASDYSEIMRRGLPELDDLLLTTEAPLGHAALVDRTDVAFAQRVIRFRFDRARIVPRFALASLLSMPVQQQFMMLGTGSTALGIKASKLPMVRVALPPLAEQQQILAVVQPIVAQLEGALTAVLREVTLLHEYRTRLISDVVTGKLDVREAAAHLPDEAPDELEVEPPLDDEPTDDADALDTEEPAA